MLTTIKIIFTILCSFPSWHGETETLAQREARLGIIATSIAIASEGDQERAIALLVQGDNETHWAEHVHAGRCEQHPKSRRGECDAAWVKTRYGRVRVHRARGPWQGHRAAGRAGQLWDNALGDGLAPTVNAAILADYYLQGRRCGGDLARMYAAQGGRGCVATPSGLKRAAQHRRLRSQWFAVAKELAE